MLDAGFTALIFIDYIFTDCILMWINAHEIINTNGSHILLEMWLLIHPCGASIKVLLISCVSNLYIAMVSTQLDRIYLATNVLLSLMQMSFKESLNQWYIWSYICFWNEYVSPLPMVFFIWYMFLKSICLPTTCTAIHRYISSTTVR